MDAAKTRTKRARRPYTSAEQRRRADVVAAHRDEFGDWCPGWQRDHHLVEPPNVLTAAHLTAVGAGGSEHGPLGVLCRDCNSRQGTSPT